MRFLFILSVITFLIISCTKTNIQTGTYKGTFQRSISNKVSNVTLQLSSNTFKGQSEFIHYPDICQGSFSVNRDSISFSDGCFYTAEFDWTYVLSGKYKISVSGDSLIMTRDYNGFAYYYDTYKLKRQKS